MIESIKIKLVSGAEVELTIDQARQLFDELQQLFGEPAPSPVFPPVLVPSLDWMRPPYIVTC